MEKIASRNITALTKVYLLLTKPGIILGNIITMAGGFFLAARGQFDWFQLFLSMVALAMVIASAAICNNYIDRELDQKMERTKNRGFAQGSLSVAVALLLALFLVVIGTALLIRFTNLLTASIAITGFIVYVFVYSFVKPRTTFGTIIGSIAGAIPPVVGYCSISNQFDLAALLLFAMLVTWQIPHFFAIAIYRLEDYKAAGLPLLPLVKGMKRTKIEMAFYTFFFAIVSSSLWWYQYLNTSYLLLSLYVSSFWFVLSLKGFKAKDEKKWGRQMFLFSLVVILSLSLMIPFSVI